MPATGIFLKDKIRVRKLKVWRFSQKAAWPCVLLIFFLVLLFPGQAAPADSPRFQWKFATLAPRGMGPSVQLEHLVKPRLKEVSKGDIKIIVYWSGVMGDDLGIIRKMRFGHLNGAGLTGRGVTNLSPEMSVMSLPFLFKDYGEVDYVRDKMRPDFTRFMERSGMFLFTLVDQGFDQTYSTKWDFTRAKDFQTARFLTWFGPMEEEFFKGLGSNPVPVSFSRMLSGLKDDMGDSVMGPAILVVGSQMFTVVKYANSSKIRYSPAACVIRMEDWSLLPQEYVDKYHELRADIESKFCATMRKDDKRYLIALKKYGISVVQTEETTLEIIRKKTMPMWQKLAGKIYPQKVLDQVLGHLEQYRAMENKTTP